MSVIAQQARNEALEMRLQHLGAGESQQTRTRIPALPFAASRRSAPTLAPMQARCALLSSTDSLPQPRSPWERRRWSLVTGRAWASGIEPNWMWRPRECARVVVGGRVGLGRRKMGALEPVVDVRRKEG